LTASSCFQDKNVQWLDMSHLIQYINNEHSAEPFSKEEISCAIQRMTDDNQIMVSEDMVFLI
jgi:DNA replication licensing factor MCM3